jgi:valyl-tRNA synthetase
LSKYSYAPSAVDEAITANLYVADLVDVVSEKARLAKKMSSSQAALDRMMIRTSTEVYRTKTPVHVREKDAETVERLQGEISVAQSAIEGLTALHASFQQ